MESKSNEDRNGVANIVGNNLQGLGDSELTPAAMKEQGCTEINQESSIHVLTEKEGVDEKGDELKKPAWMDPFLPSESHPNDTNHSYSFGRGIVDDFQRTVRTHWVQEMTNFNQKTLAVSFFLFFAAIVSLTKHDTNIIYSKPHI